MLYHDLSELNLPKLSSLWEQAQATLSQQSSQVKEEKLKPLDNSIVGSTAEDMDQLTQWRNIGDPRHDQTTTLLCVCVCVCVCRSGEGG